MTILTITTLIAEISGLLGIIVPMLIRMSKISNGTKCQLRTEMLRIYYDNIESGKIRQYQYENFIYLYEAYKALGGNSFIDKIYSEIKSLEIIS